MATNIESHSRLYLQCKSELREQQLTGKSFDEALQRVYHLYGSNALTEDEARKHWFEREQLTIEQRRVIFSVYHPIRDDHLWWMYHFGTHVIYGRYVYCMQQRQATQILLLDLFHEKMNHITLDESTLPDELLPISSLYFSSIEPLNHTLVALIAENEETRRFAIMLARIHPSSTDAVCSSAKKAKLDDDGDAQLGHQWTFSIIDFRLECLPEERWFELETRQTNSSLILRTRSTFKFYDIVNDKIIIKYEIAQQKVADNKENSDDEEDYPSPDWWTVIDDRFHAINKAIPERDEQESDTEREPSISKYFEYSISECKRQMKKELQSEATDCPQNCWIDDRLIEAKTSESSKISNTFKVFDIKTKKWSETGLTTWQSAYKQLFGTDRALIIATGGHNNDTRGLKFYRLPVKKPDSLLALAWTTARLRGENDAEWYEALMRKLPPNIEVRPWHGFI